MISCWVRTAVQRWYVIMLVSLRVMSSQLVCRRVGRVSMSGIHRPSSRLLRPRRNWRSVPRRVADRLPLTTTRQPPAVHTQHQRRLPLRLDDWTMVRGTATRSFSRWNSIFFVINPTLYHIQATFQCCRLWSFCTLLNSSYHQSSVFGRIFAESIQLLCILSDHQ